MGPGRRASHGGEPERRHRDVPSSDGGNPLHRSIARRAALAVVGLLALAPAAQAATSSSRATLTNSTPDWATPNAQVGSVPDSAQHTFWVYLSMRNSKALDAAIAATTNPASAGYGKYLTPDQFRARYAPTDADVAAVRAYLKQAGFAVSADRPDNNRWVEASGTTAQVEQAFKTQLRTYQHRGKTLQAPNGDLSVARSISSRIAGIAGLDGSDRLMRPDTADAPPAPAFVNAPPCSTSWGEKVAVDDQGNPTVPPAYGQQFLPYATCGYTPNQLQGAYGTKAAVAGGLDGHGQTVAIVDAFASPTIPQDANQYATTHGQPAVDFSQITPEDRSNDPIGGPDQCDAQGWYGEETLDVEAVHAMAPGAHVLFVGGADCLDESLIDAVNKIVDGNLAQIVSNSYGNLGETGEDAGLRQAWNDTFRQAALEGIGMYFSSGDSGDEVDNLGHPEATSRPRTRSSPPWAGPRWGVEQQRRLPVRDRLGHDEQHADQRRLGSGAARQPHLRLRRRHEPVLRRARLPEAGGPEGAGQGQRRKPARVVPDVSLVGDPNTGHARRPDPDVPRRDDDVRRVPPRRHQPVLAALGGGHGPGRPAGGPSPRLRQPGAVRPVRHAGLPRRRRARPAHRGRAQRLPELGRRQRRDQDDAAHVRPDAEPAHHSGLRRRHRRRQPERAEVPRRAGRGGRPLATMADTGPRLPGAAPRLSWRGVLALALLADAVVACSLTFPYTI